MTGVRIAVTLAILALASAAADAQTPARVRGTITAVEPNVLAVKSRDGQDLRLALPDNATVAVAKAVRFEDIKPGDYVGSTALKRPDGALVAVEVHYLPPTAAPGHTPWDLQPGATMTNTSVEAAVQSAGNRELTLKYPDGMQKILVPEGVPIVRGVPGARSDLAVGEYVFVIAQAAPDGKLTALRIQVSKDGVKPPQ
jgi:Domain of unknown function (DUF5666)